jgi:hypothetical protein
MTARDDYSDVGTIDAEDVGSTAPILPSAPRYPDPPAREVFRGVFGELVTVLEPHTEADPIAILVQALAAFGSVIGRGPHFIADGTAHFTNLFAVLVAASSKGRKGTAWSHVRNCFTAIDPTWRIVSGLSSGEGIIWQVRDARYVEREIRRSGRATGEHETVLEDAGVEDKRLFVAETEFARVLRVGEREGGRGRFVGGAARGWPSRAVTNRDVTRGVRPEPFVPGNRAGAPHAAGTRTGVGRSRSLWRGASGRALVCDDRTN